MVDEHDIGGEVGHCFAHQRRPHLDNLGGLHAQRARVVVLVSHLDHRRQLDVVHIRRQGEVLYGGRPRQQQDREIRTLAGQPCGNGEIAAEVAQSIGVMSIDQQSRAVMPGPNGRDSGRAPAQRRRTQLPLRLSAEPLRQSDPRPPIEQGFGAVGCGRRVGRITARPRLLFDTHGLPNERT